MANGWKITAIFVIVLLVIETIAFIGLFILGVSIARNESKCNSEICAGNYTAYYFDDETNVCYCYTNNEITKQEVIQ
jgi:hypothetical protein